MDSIFAKALICRGNTQVHLHFFCKSKLQSTQKGPAATQMDRSSASSEISFHELPSKTKHHSIRKHSVVVIITVNSISFYQTAICREIFSKYFFASTVVNLVRILSAHQKTFRKVLESSQKYTRGEVLCQQSCRFLHEQPPDARSVKMCSQKGVRKIHRKRPVSETLFYYSCIPIAVKQIP